MSERPPDPAEPLQNCDLVMKGGITSGIVYPPAVLELCRKYRFRSIGGTSAGAIAAAVTAAAEFARESGGFERLKGVNDWLGNGTNLFDLFQPTKGTRPLLTAILEINHLRGAKEHSDKERLLRRGEKGKTGRVSWRKALWFTPKALRKALPIQYWLFALAGGALGLLLGALLAKGADLGPTLSSPIPLIVGLVTGIAVGWVLAILGSAGILGWILARRVPESFFGVCTGRKGACDRSAPALTDWLHTEINCLAGLDPGGPPLTFGQLSRKDPAIELRTVTTNVTLGEPCVVPFDELYLAKTEEMNRLFPEAVAQHLITKARTSRRLSLDPEAFKGYFFLPRPEDMPVVVAARLSLSFPVLLSAVPLYAVKRSAFATKKEKGVVRLTDPTEDLDRLWFSDGGISSNFPIHFFDSWFPRWPTFGLNLASVPAEVFEGGELAIPSQSPQSRMRLRKDCQTVSTGDDEFEDGWIGDQPSDPSSLDDASDAVFLPRPNAPQYAAVAPIRGLPGFLGAIWSTAQNYRDNMQARLPSYRERIVQIRFAPDEGGLNLAMGPDAIKSIREKGQLAGIRLREEFNLTDHRWVRLRVLLSELEANLRQSRRAFPTADAYREFLESLSDGAPYREDTAWRGRACEYLTALSGMISSWEDLHKTWSGDDRVRREVPFFSRGAPRPPSSLRVTPRV